MNRSQRSGRQIRATLLSLQPFMLCTTLILGSRSNVWSSQPTFVSLERSVLRTEVSSAHQAHKLGEHAPGSHLNQPWAWSGKDSRLSCFSSVLCTHVRSTLPKPWVQGLIIARQQTRGCASTASWPGWARQPDAEMLGSGAAE